MSRIALTDKLRQEIASLDDLSRKELVEQWHKAHGCLPPKGVKRDLLLHSAAWHLQAKRLGGLRGDVKRTLKRLMQASDFEPGLNAGSQAYRRKNDTKAVTSMHCKLPPGARLVREWNGRLHVVEVEQDGFLHEGKTYRSLTAVAKRITGTNWSGPRFFGL